MRLARVSFLHACVFSCCAISLAPPQVAKAEPPSAPSVTSLPDSSAGVPIGCVDMRTGNPFMFQAQRLLLSGSRDASWMPDSSRLCLGSMEGVEYTRIADGSGGAFIGWVDGRFELTDIYLQHFTAAGMPAEGWPSGGLPVCIAPNSQHHLSICADGSGGVLLVWEDFRGGSSDIYAIRVTAEGHVADGWQPNGTPITTASGEQGRPTLARSPDGVFIAWEDRRAHRSTIFITRRGVDGSTSTGWQAQGETLGVATPAIDPLLVADSLGHCGILWRHRSESGDALMAAPLDEASPVLAAAATLASDAEKLSAPFIVRRGARELLVGWTEWRAAGGTARVQVIDLGAGMQLKWPGGGASLHAGNLGVSPAVLALDGVGGVVGAWEDFAEDPEGDIYAQRLMSDGSPDTLWPSNGIAVCAKAGNQYKPWLVADGATGVIATWGDAAGGGNAGYLASRADLEGIQAVLLSAVANPGHVHIVWQAPRSAGAQSEFDVQRRLADAEWSPLARVTADRDRRIVVDDRTVAEGARAAYRLLYRDSLGTITLLPVELAVPLAPSILKLKAVIAQGRRHSLAVLFSLPRGPAPELELLDVQGRRVERQRLTNLDPGEHRFTLNLPSTLASGVYFVRLTQGTTARVSKTVYVR